MIRHIRVYECIACGRRYPMIPYYPAAAPHGPEFTCRGELGWVEVREVYPPKAATA